MTSPIDFENDHPALGPSTEQRLGVAVVIPVYNRVGLLARTLAGLVAQTYPHQLLSVVVADDGSTEDVSAAVAPFRDRLDITVVRRERDGYGAGQARNLGAEATQADILIFADADCLPDPDLVSTHARWHHVSDFAVVIGSRHQLDSTDLDPDEIETRPERLRRLAFGDAGGPSAETPSPDFRRVLFRRTSRLRHGDEIFRSLVSSNFSLLRARFLESGGFSEDFTRWGGEDTELGWRLFCAGMTFVPDNEAAIYHQTQDDAGPAGWRDDARTLNAGLLATKIPHRFYRTSRRGYLYETPKVSVVITPTVGPRARELWEQLLLQRLTDWEAQFVDDGSDELSVLAEECRADPRFRPLTSGAEAALSEARGEYVAVLHGSAGLDHRLLSRAVHRLDTRPRFPLLRVAYQVPGNARPAVYRRGDDVDHLDAAWSADLGIFSMARRRAWSLARRSTDTLGGAWDLMRSARTQRLADPLVVVPAHRRPDDLPVSVPPITSDRSLLLRDLKGGPRRAVAGAARFAVSRLRRRPYQRAAPDHPQPRSKTEDEPASIRYIGWTGHDNLGDEALLEATARLMPWGQIRTTGHADDLLLLGGGTLIGAGYLKHLVEHDSPRIERAVLGTGVADPDYWGRREEPDAWVAFLDTCCYVGVRGPRSRDILRSWGYRGPLEVVGDPALTLRAESAQPRRTDHVVVAPVWTGGELWGKDDGPVLDALAEHVRFLLDHGSQVTLLASHPNDDRPCLEVMRAAGAPDLACVAGYRSTDEALDLLASAGLVIGERLHACVLSAAVGTPFVAIEYQPKVRDFATSVDWDHVLRSDEVTSQRLAQLTESARTADLAPLHAAVDEYRSRLATATDLIREALA